MAFWHQPRVPQQKSAACATQLSTRSLGRREPLLTRLAALFSVIPIVWLACASPSAPSAEPIVVRGPTVIGFFPPLGQAEFDDPTSGASEGLAHLQFALSDVAKCLEPISPEIRLELARQLTVQVDGETTSIKLPRERDRSFGAYLVKPGATPRAVYATMGPSALQQFIPDAAAEYFGVPGCRFQL